MLRFIPKKNKGKQRIEEFIRARRRAKAEKKARVFARTWISKTRSRTNPIRKTASNSNFNKKTYKFTLFNSNQNRTGTNLNVNVNVPKRNVFGEEYMKVNTHTLPLQSWVDAQVNYIRNLNEYDFFTAMAFTNRSHQWISPYLYSGNLNNVYFSRNNGRRTVPPLYPQIRSLVFSKRVVTVEDMALLQRILNGTFNIKSLNENFLKLAYKLYVDDLHRIIKNAPPLPRKMVVYRGLDTNMFKTGMKSVQTMPAFASASYVPNNMYGFQDYMKITLPRGSRVLLLQCLNPWLNSNQKPKGEYEVLLNKGTKYVIMQRDVRRPVINSNKQVRMRHVTDVKVYDTPR